MDAPTPTTDSLEPLIIAALRSVYDPEIPVNVYDLGLIYDIQVYPDQTVLITMTLTAPGCPAAGTLPTEVAERVREVEGIKQARVELTFDPPYSPEMMSDEAKFELGFM